MDTLTETMLWQSHMTHIVFVHHSAIQIPEQKECTGKVSCVHCLHDATDIIITDTRNHPLSRFVVSSEFNGWSVEKFVEVDALTCSTEGALIPARVSGILRIRRDIGQR